MKHRVLWNVLNNDKLFLKVTNKNRNISSKELYKCFEDARNFFKCHKINKIPENDTYISSFSYEKDLKPPQLYYNINLVFS